jgi:hypothetical protein
MTDWTVLVTADLPATQPPLTAEDRERVLAGLPGDDKWAQYPPASGRGHGFEVRWWIEGDDPGEVGAAGVEAYLRAVEAAGIADPHIILVHVASPSDRLTESVLGLERRMAGREGSDEWNVMIRAVAGADVRDRRFGSGDRDRLLSALPGQEVSAFARDGLVEARFWVAGDDAVDATATAASAFRSVLAGLGHADWTIVRAHAASVAEVARAAYHGVERRVLATPGDTGHVAVRVNPGA